MFDYLFPDLRKRSFEKELMDDFQSDKVKLLNTVRQFGLINRLFSSSMRLIKKNIVSDMKRDPSKSYTLLDIGAGGCDIPVRLIRHVRRNGLHLKITAVDYDERIVEYSRQLLKDYPEIEVVSDSLENLSGYKKFDYVISNNVLHHFEWKDMTGLLSVLGKVTKRMFIMNDIHRSNFGYFFYSVFAGLFLKNSFAFYDGRLSIKKGFVKNELSVIMDGIGYEFPVRVEYVIPERVVIIGDMN